MKDITTSEWTGAAVAMAESIADVWGAEVLFVETTFGNSVLDVQSNKIDIAFALNPIPQRALAIGLTRPSSIRIAPIPAIQPPCSASRKRTPPRHGPSAETRDHTASSEPHTAGAPSGGLGCSLGALPPSRRFAGLSKLRSEGALRPFSSQLPARR